MRLITLILLLLITATSCKKYDEGPSLSLLSKNARLTGKWELAAQYLNDTELRIVNKEDMSVNKNGTFTRSILMGTNSFTSNGNWALSDDKMQLLMTYSASSIESWTIKRLSNKQLFIELIQNNGSLVRYEYVKKVKQ